MSDKNLSKETLIQCAEEFGLPLYVYNAGRIASQVKDFRSAFNGVNMKIKYACKALTNINILKLMKSLGTGLDTVSLSEIKMGLIAGFKPEEIIFTPNSVSFEEINEAVEIGVSINIENVSNLVKFGQQYGDRYPCAIRLNPFIVDEVDESTSEWYNTSKFGIALSQFEKVHETIRKYSIRVNGIHLHSSSVVLDSDIFLKGAETIFKLAMDFKELEFIDMGGGIKVPCSPGEKTIDIFDLGKALKPAYDKFCSDCGKEFEIWFEPGRYLVMESGYLLAEVVVVKSNGFVEFAGLNTGFNHLIRPMMYGAYHEVVNLSNPEGDPKKYNVVGNVCEIDNFCIDREVAEIREGDILAFENAGAYGYSMASTYNSRFRPAEVLVEDGIPRLIRKRDTFEDLLSNQIY
jgi:diaminopimelate decarboxylase